MVSLHVVASVYQFSEPARADLEKIFTATPSGKETKFHTPTSSNTFMLTCDETAMADFLRLIDRFIKDEECGDLDVFEDAKVLRMKGTSSAASVQPFEILKTKLPVPEGPDPQPLIEHETFMGTLGLTAPTSCRPRAAMLARIELLGQCRIEIDETAFNYIVKADTEANLQKSLAKLQVINTTAMDQIPSCSEFLCSEAEIEFALAFRPLKDLNDRRARTTLLSPSQSAGFFNSALILVMIKQDQVFQVKEKPRVLTEGRLWKDNCHASFGNSQKASSEAIHHRLQMKNQPESIRQWIDSATTASTNPFLPDISPTPPPTVHEHVKVEHPDETQMTISPPKKKMTKRSRVAKGDPGAETNQPTIQASRQTNAQSTTQSNGLADLLDDEDSQGFTNQRSNRSYIDPPEIAPPVMPTHVLQSPSPKISHTAVNNTPAWETNFNSTSYDLLGLLEPDSFNKNTNASSRNPGSSTTRHTMNQKAPVHSFDSYSTSSRIYEAVKKLLPLALSRTGPLTLRVDIGRLLIHHPTRSPDARVKIFREPEWMDVFSAKDGKYQTSFTNILTGRSSEAESILDLRLHQGRRMFTETPHERKASYQLFCKSKGGERFLVEVNEDRSYEIRGADVLLGATNWHFPKRSWDARLALNACEFIGGGYESRVEAMIKSIGISPPVDGKGLALSIQAPDEDVKIERVLSHRQTKHTSPLYPDLLLQLTEVQDLKVQALEDSPSHYIGYIMTEEEMAIKNRLWWEASFSSSRVANILKENQTLELGEQAAWKAEAVLAEGHVGDMASLAQEIITRIDHVGLHNRSSQASFGIRTSQPPSFPGRVGLTLDTFW